MQFMTLCMRQTLEPEQDAMPYAQCPVFSDPEPERDSCPA